MIASSLQGVKSDNRAALRKGNIICRKLSLRIHGLPDQIPYLFLRIYYRHSDKFFNPSRKLSLGGRNKGSDLRNVISIPSSM